MNKGYEAGLKQLNHNRMIARIKSKRANGEKLTEDEMYYLKSAVLTERNEKIRNAWLPADVWFGVCGNVCEKVFGLSLDAIREHNRKKEVVFARHAIMAAAYDAGYSLKSIGAHTNRSHATVLHSRNTSIDLHRTYPPFRTLFNNFIKTMYDAGANIADDTLFLAGITPDNEPEQNTEVCEQGRSELVSC